MQTTTLGFRRFAFPRVTAKGWAGLGLALLLASVQQSHPMAAEPHLSGSDSGPLQLQVVGSLSGLNQYTQHEEPFWTERIPARSGGRITAKIAAFDSSGIRGSEMLQLLRLGAVSMGTALLPLVATEEPELGGIDLPGLNPDVDALRDNLTAFRPLMAEALKDRYGIELLAVFTYPAQVVFCKEAFFSLQDLTGRRIRTSNLQQSDFVEALGGLPILTPFSQIIERFENGSVDCAITGSMSGNTIGLQTRTRYQHAMAIQWGLSIFAANGALWQSLEDDQRDFLSAEIASLEEEVWTAAALESEDGLACNAGLSSCIAGRRGAMSTVKISSADRELVRVILDQVVLPRWAERCGADCTARWNDRMSALTGLRAALN